MAPKKNLNSKELEKRLIKFNQLLIAHPKLQEVDNHINNFLRNPCSSHIALVYGPTGVGKTVLSIAIKRRILEKHLSALENNPGIIPIVWMRVSPPHLGQFSWRSFYIDALEAINEPLIQYKTDVNVKYNRTANATTLEKAFKKALKHRQTSVVIIDEAQHFGKIASGKRLLDQMDVIKTLSEDSGTLYILFGTYDLWMFRDLSGQLARRNQSIHFPRYYAERKEDITNFKSILHTFETHLPFEKKPELVKNWDYFYERSIGCVGILKNWLERSISKALYEGKNTIYYKHLQDTALSISQCEKIIRESINGENNVLESEKTNEELIRLLKIETKEHPARRGKRDVGKRNPQRDPVGVQTN